MKTSKATTTRTRSRPRRATRRQTVKAPVPAALTACTHGDATLPATAAVPAAASSATNQAEPVRHLFITINASRLPDALADRLGGLLSALYHDRRRELASTNPSHERAERLQREMQEATYGLLSLACMLAHRDLSTGVMSTPPAGFSCCHAA